MYINISFLERFKKAIIGLFVIFSVGFYAAHAGNSVLSEGTWYKMSISSTGMYKLTYSDLSNMGIDVAKIDPRNIRIYHNGGGVLPKINKSYYPDDLYEIPIYVYGESDGVFNQNDYIIFYARGPVVWKYNSQKQYYNHVKNPYTSYTYAFITVGDEPGRRIQTEAEPHGSTIVEVADYLDYQVKDVDEVNINNMGCTWFFDKFDATLQRTYEFSFNNLNTSKNVKMRAAMASRNTSTASMVLKYNNNQLYSKSFGNADQYIYARHDTTCLVGFKASGSPIKIDVKYNRAMASSEAWMDYISLNAWCYLKMSGDVLSFRNPECSDVKTIYRYNIQNATSSVKVWDVTDPINPMMMSTTLSASTMSFEVNGNSNNQFVAFNGSSFKKPASVVKVSNQNLHAKKDIDYLIITNANFKSHAERLKKIHSRIDDLVIDIVQPKYIYNEFSCGALDVAGIRNFIKMLYKNSSDEHKLKYVLLLGDASYDYKNSDVCLVPTWESFESCVISKSVVTDDFYVCLDDNEGDMENYTSTIDVSIARMPVSTAEEATIALNKIESYIAGNSSTMNNWRNVVTFMCDDKDALFFSTSENLAKNIKKWGGDVIVDKIYLDAYNQVATASGQRCPEMNEAIINRIERGSLVVNYYGHGGEIGLGDERFLTVDNINSLANKPMMPLFVTATCEFSRFDDHTRTSAGEMLYLNRKGGAIAMITTARTTGGSSGLLNRTYSNMFKMTDGEYPTMGEIFFHSKQDTDPNTKVFVLFGDPALRLAYPKNNVVLTKLNGKPVSYNDTLMNNDTLKALSTIELQGIVTDNFGETMTDFNGMVRVSVYDKENTYKTKGDEGGMVYSFKLRNSLLFDGKAVVDSGRFTIKFMLPKDINYSYGKGLISFYATDYQTDANGMYGDVVVGGYDATAEPDEQGPKMKVYIDDTLFVSGGITNENPVLYAFLKDEHGINTAGSGIGHDIVATLSGATNKAYNLNMYYDSPFDLNDYGTIVYRFYGLNEGDHHLTLKAWDIYNNSTTVSLDFTVVKSKDVAVQNVFNAPNPMTDYTNFMFEHNQKDDVYITINIYNISGQLVKTIKESRYGTSLRIDPIRWDGRADNGMQLPSGVYVYNVTVTTNDNQKITGFSKLVIAR